MLRRATLALVHSTADNSDPAWCGHPFVPAAQQLNSSMFLHTHFLDRVDFITILQESIAVNDDRRINFFGRKFVSRKQHNVAQ